MVFFICVILYNIHLGLKMSSIILCVFKILITDIKHICLFATFQCYVYGIAMSIHIYNSFMLIRSIYYF